MKKLINLLNINQQVLCFLQSKSLFTGAFGALFLIASCENEIPYKGENEDPLLVINALCENDSVFRVDLERSIFFLSKEPDSVKYIKSGATLKLTDLSTGTVYTQTSPIFGSTYEFPLTKLVNTSYKIEASHPDYPTASSEMTSVSKINLTSVDTSSYNSVNNGQMKKAVLKWDDPLGENFYMIKVFVHDPIGPYDYSTSFLTTDLSFEQDNAGGQNYYDIMYFTDALFEGKTKEFEIEFNTYFQPNPSDNPIYSYHLISIDKATYQYLISAEKNSNSGFFSEPVKVFTNITNGFGIFGSISRSVIVH